MEMISGGLRCRDAQTKIPYQAYFNGNVWYDRVLVEPSGIYDIDEFFDVLRDEPLDRWYEIGNVIAVVNAGLEESLSDQAEFLLASEVADAGSIVLSRSQGSACDEAGCDHRASEPVSGEVWLQTADKRG